jgi:hypothetical protein
MQHVPAGMPLDAELGVSDAAGDPGAGSVLSAPPPHAAAAPAASGISSAPVRQEMRPPDGAGAAAGGASPQPRRGHNTCHVVGACHEAT